MRQFALVVVVFTCTGYALAGWSVVAAGVDIARRQQVFSSKVDLVRI
jgi:hypothetical protein